MLVPNFQPISVDEFLQSANVQTESIADSTVLWTVLVVDKAHMNEVISELEESVPIFIDFKIQIISAKDGVTDFIQNFERRSHSYLLLHDFDGWNPKDWEMIDLYRGRLEVDNCSITLLLSPESIQKMGYSAPNFLSWFGGRIFKLVLGAEYLTPDEIEHRLSILHQWSGQSDAEVIQLAEQNELPAEPEYGEWLILLNRGDLIGQ